LAQVLEIMAGQSPQIIGAENGVWRLFLFACFARLRPWLAMGGDVSREANGFDSAV
jgi:hypothetical protein